jgi:single-strand DNA-binding protein
MGDDDLDDGPTDEELMATMGDWDPRVAEMNTVHLIGRLGNDPEPRYFDDGNVVVNLSLACGRKYHYMERQVMDVKYGQEETDWYGLEIWGGQAEFISKFVDKGARVAVTGSLQLDEWADKNSGETRVAVKVIVREFDVLETKAEAELRRGGAGGGGGGNKGREKSFYVNDPDENRPKSGSSGGFFD